MDNWISVKDRVPPKSDHINTQRVLLFVKGQPNSPYLIGYGIMKDGVNYPYEIKGWRKVDEACNLIFGEVTHWQPLPPPPETK